MPRPSARLRCEALEDRTTPVVFTVDTPLDVVDPTDGLTSLREAIAAAQAVPPPTGTSFIYTYPVVRFTAALAGATIPVSQVGGTPAGPSAFEIRRPVNVEGSGQKIVPTAAGYRLFTVFDESYTSTSTALILSKVELVGWSVAGDGGAMSVRGGFVTVTDSVLANNSADGSGGAIELDRGHLNVSNSTLTGNAARSGTGGAILSRYGYPKVMTSTLVGNTAAAGAQIAASGSYLLLTDSILSTPGAAATDLLVDTTVSSLGSRNLIGSAAGYKGGVLSSADPLLGPLQDNGGPTRTMLPQAGSPAVDRGDVDLTLSGTAVADQRGFPRGVGRKTDLGAAEAGATVDGTGYAPPAIAVGAAAGGLPEVRVLRQDGTEVTRFLAYNAGFRGGVQVALADLTGDGIPDYVTAPGAGGGPHVRVFDGFSYELVREFFAFDPGFRGGVSLTVSPPQLGGTVPDIIVGAGAGGGPHVKVFDGETGELVQSFFAFDPGFRGGVSVASVDESVVVGAGPGGAPHVKVFDLFSLREQLSFFAYEPGFRGGVNVTYTNGHIVTGTASGAPHVKAFRDNRFRGAGVVPPELASFFAGDPAAVGGVAVGRGQEFHWPAARPGDPPAAGAKQYLYTSAGGGGLTRYSVDISDVYELDGYFYRPVRQVTTVTEAAIEQPVTGAVRSADGLPGWLGVPYPFI